MVASRDDLKRRVLAALDDLPEGSLSEVATFLDFQRFKLSGRPAEKAPYRPVPLGGIWRGVRIGDEEIADVRQEMWSRFTANEP
jgi:hypothetical protein